MEAIPAGSRVPRWLWVAAIWLSFGLFDATQTVFAMRAEGMHHAWGHLFFSLIEYGLIENTLYMERGAFETPNTDAVVFRVDPDKKHAERLTVRFGVIASELIEIKSGLREGDKVIVTDMRRFAASERLRIE